MSIFKFPVHSVRTVQSPSNPDIKTHFVYVNFHDLPDNFNLDVNPRVPNMKTTVAKALIAAVKGPDTDFDINNRGMVLVAKEFDFNKKKLWVEIEFGNSEEYGVLDGGHTYKAILIGRDDLDKRVNKFVKLEIIVGENITASHIADARNTSVSVSDVALFELDGKFDFIKEAIKDEPYAAHLSMKDNDKDKDHWLQIEELIKLMFAYNILDPKKDLRNSPPIQAYSGKAAVLKDFKRDLDNYQSEERKKDYLQLGEYPRLTKILPDLVELYDVIEQTIGEVYRDYNPSGKFGRIRGIDGDNGKGKYSTLFLRNKADYKVSLGYMWPIFGAFVVLLDVSPEGEIFWKADPKEVWNLVGVDLLRNTLGLSGNKPNDAGKNSLIWTTNFRAVENAYNTVENRRLRELLKQQA